MQDQLIDTASAVIDRQSRPKRAAFLKAEEFIKTEIQAMKEKKAAALQEKLKQAKQGKLAMQRVTALQSDFRCAVFIH